MKISKDCKIEKLCVDQKSTGLNQVLKKILYYEKLWRDDAYIVATNGGALVAHRIEKWNRAAFDGVIDPLKFADARKRAAHVSIEKPSSDDMPKDHQVESAARVNMPETAGTVTISIDAELLYRIAVAINASPSEGVKGSALRNPKGRLVNLTIPVTAYLDGTIEAKINTPATVTNMTVEPHDRFNCFGVLNPINTKHKAVPVERE